MTPATRDAVERALRELLEDPEVAIAPDEDLFEAGHLDSFRMLEFITAIEETFGLEIPTDDLIPQNLWNLDAAAALVDRLRVGSGR